MTPPGSTALVACAATLLTFSVPAGAQAAEPPAPLVSAPADSVESTYGGGNFGSWAADEYGMPVYRYGLDQNASPIAPRVEMGGSRDAWHQVGNDRIHAEAHNDGRVQFWSEERLNQWLNLPEPGAQHYGGGYGYLALEGKVYSTRWEDRSPGAAATRDWGIGYAGRETSAGPARIEERVYAPFGDDPLLLHDVTISNTSERRLQATWWEYWDVNPVPIPNLGGHRHRSIAAPTYDAATQTLTVEQYPDAEAVIVPDLNLLTGAADPVRHLPPLKDAQPLAIFASALRTHTDGFETDARVFFGSGSRGTPEAALRDRATNSLAPPALVPAAAGHTLLAFRSPITVAPGASVTLRYAYGTAQPGEIHRTVRRYRDARAPFDESARSWAGWLPKAFFGARRRWLARELQWAAYTVRSRASFQEACGHHILNQGGYYAYSAGIQAAFRDPLQHQLGLIEAAPGLSRETILYSAREQRADTGSVPWGMLSLCRPFEIGTSGDMDFWLMFAASEYVLGTRDVAFLDAVEPYADHGQSTVWEHLKLAVRHQESLIGRGLHGLYSPGTVGDWADFATEVYGMTESTVISGHMAYVYPRLAEVARLRGDTAFARRLEALAARARAAVQRQWTGRWYSRGYSVNRQIGDGTLYSDAQWWPVLAGVPNRDQARSIVANARRFLTGWGAPHGPSQVGSAHVPAADDPLVSEPPPAKALMSAFAVGDNNAGYFGGNWFVVNGWMTWALANLDGIVDGAGAYALDELERNTLARHAAAFPDRWNGVLSIDDACWAYYSSDPGRCGIQSLSGGLAASTLPAYAGMNLQQPGWLLWDVQKLAGIEPTAQGLRIAPHLPLPQFSVRFPDVGVALERQRMRGYIRPQADAAMQLEVTLPIQANPQGAIAWVDGRRVASAATAHSVRFKIDARHQRRADWAVTWDPMTGPTASPSSTRSRHHDDDDDDDGASSARRRRGGRSNDSDEIVPLRIPSGIG